MRKLLFVLICVLVLALTVSVSAEKAKNAGLDIVLGSSGLSAGNTVWFGRKSENVPLDKNWLVLKNADGKVLLVSRYLWDRITYTKPDILVGWENSNAKKWCENLYQNWPFAIEKDAIAATVKNETGSYDVDSPYGVMPFRAAPLQGERFFFLSAEETDTLLSAKTAYYPDGRAGIWWLRSPGNETTYSSAGIVTTDGILLFGTASDSFAARPACNLNIYSLLFISASEGGKPTGECEMTKIVPSSNTDWKLTLLDADNKFEAKMSTAVAEPGETIQIPYEKAHVGYREFISVFLCDGYGSKASFYCSVPAMYASGTISVTLPENIEGGNYTLKVFNEHKNPEGISDYGSRFSSVKLKITSSALPSASDSGTTGDCTWKFYEANGNLVISGTGAMADYSSTADLPWYNYLDKITSVKIDGNVTRIGERAFSFTPITSILIPDSVESIGASAFFGCNSLGKAVLGSGLKTVGQRAFCLSASSSDFMTGIEIPSNVTKIGEKAFGYKLDQKLRYSRLDGFRITGDCGSAAWKYAKDDGFDFTSEKHAWDNGTVTTQPLCDKAGIKTFTCVCGKTRTEEIPALSHQWGEPAYTWADDHSTVTAKRICGRDSSHIETETVGTTGEVTTAATEDHPGVMTYTSNKFKNPAFKVQTTTIAIPQLDPNASSHTLTIHYFKADGTQAAQSYAQVLKTGTPYSVISPFIEGYTPDKASVSGVMGTEDITVTVTYKPNNQPAPTTPAPAPTTPVPATTTPPPVPTTPAPIPTTPVPTTPVPDQPTPGPVQNQVTVSGVIYKLDHAKKTATLIKVASKSAGTEAKALKKLTIPASVKANGKSYKVTAIAPKACKGQKKLTTLTIGKNVTTIGSSAFINCKNLKTIKVLTSKITKKGVGKSCFKGIAANPTFKVPRKKLRNYQDWFISIGKAPKTSKFSK